MQYPLKHSTNFKSTYRLIMLVLTIVLLLISLISAAADQTKLIDDFTHPLNNNYDYPRQFVNDSMVGGKTATTTTINESILHLSGDLVPPRGQPGWASTILPLNADGQAVDASAFTGIRLLLKINKGSMSLSANSTEIKNFDYHSALISAPADGSFHKVSIPFASMRRGWSEQSQLNTQSINSISIVAFSLQNASFDFEIDEVSFY